jgi:hypothetical protein
LERESAPESELEQKMGKRIRSAGALRSSSQKGHKSAVAKKGEIERREEQLAAGIDTGCYLYCLALKWLRHKIHHT